MVHFQNAQHHTIGHTELTVTHRDLQHGARSAKGFIRGPRKHPIGQHRSRRSFQQPVAQCLSRHIRIHSGNGPNERSRFCDFARQQCRQRRCCVNFPNHDLDDVGRTLGRFTVICHPYQHSIRARPLGLRRTPTHHAVAAHRHPGGCCHRAVAQTLGRQVRVRGTDREAQQIAFAHPARSQRRRHGRLVHFQNAQPHGIGDAEVSITHRDLQHGTRSAKGFIRGPSEHPIGQYRSRRSFQQPVAQRLDGHIRVHSGNGPNERSRFCDFARQKRCQRRRRRHLLHHHREGIGHTLDAITHGNTHNLGAGSLRLGGRPNKVGSHDLGSGRSHHQSQVQRLGRKICVAHPDALDIGHQLRNHRIGQTGKNRRLVHFLHQQREPIGHHGDPIAH